MQAMFFGPPDKKLFGVYYPPQGRIAQDRGVILCSPLAAYPCRCLHYLGTLFAKAGLPAFRFDYFGTADSAGDLDEGSVSQWLQDLDCAAGELRRRGCQRLSVVGLSFGATIAALYAKERDSVASLVLWEPRASGRDHIEEMQRSHELAFTGAGVPCPEIDGELLGQPFPQRLRAEVCALDLSGSFDGPLPPVLLIEHRVKETPSLRAELEKSGRAFEHEVVELDSFWESPAGLTLVPRPLLERIVTWVAAA